MGFGTVIVLGVSVVLAPGEMPAEDAESPSVTNPRPAPQQVEPSPAPAPRKPSVEDELRRAKNEYAFGNYEESVRRLRGLLYPMRLGSDQQVIEARRYLALSYYLLGDKELLQEEFTKLLFLDPDYELDPFSIAPPVIELFEQLRRKLKPELDVIRQRKVDERLQEPSPDSVLRTIDRTVIERSEITTFLPFGAGQFQNGDTELGVFFAVTEAVLLAVNVGAFLYARYGIETGFSPGEQNTVQALTFAQYGSLVLLGTVYSLGVFQARLNFVPTIEAPPVITDAPLLDSSSARPPVSPGVLLNFDF
ncbi:MAG: hypothetical protein AAF658_10045 [Myxococcota bacterium]